VGRGTDNRPGRAEKAPRSFTPEELQKLVGRWVRTDSPYVIEVRNVKKDGKIDASYFNPQPINVSVAEVREKDDKPGIYVEMRDTNYPGSNYTLAYDANTDSLQGLYFQAVQGMSFNVSFTREKK
jgi:hypothetical protein